MNASSESTLGAGLGSLFDLPGVHGSFLVAAAGNVVARALPEVVDDATLSEVGGRVVRLGETFRTVGVEPELCVLRFAEHKLYVKTLPGGVLCIVTGSDTSVPALRMAANLVARKVGPELVRLGAAPSAAPAPATLLGITPRASSSGFAAVQAQVAPSAAGGGTEDEGTAPSGPAVRMYRGRPIG